MSIDEYSTNGLVSSDFTTLLNFIPMPILAVSKDFIPIWYNIEFSNLTDNIDSILEKIKILYKDAALQISIDGMLYNILFNKNTLFSKSESYLIAFQKDLSAKDEELKTIAHDLSNIFTGISNSIELLNHKKDQYPKIIRTIQGLENNSNRAIELFEEFLSKDKSSKPNKKKINLNILLEEVALTVSEIIKNESAIKLELNEELNPILGRYSEIYRIILNLCVNAKDAIKHSDGLIVITARNIIYGDNEPRAEIEVTDNGEGIEKENIKKIFNKGFSTKKSKKISGLGLSIVKQIIEEHNGSIEVDSIIDKGTKFTIQFPTVAKKEKKPDSALPKTICIAEDEEIIREELTELFEYEGFKVIQAKDGIAAVEKLKANNDINLLIIDKKMPNQDGLTSIEKIRSNQSNIPIILATGSIPDSETRMIQEMNIDLIMKKPYSIDELIESVKKLLE